MRLRDLTYISIKWFFLYGNEHAYVISKWYENTRKIHKQLIVIEVKKTCMAKVHIVKKLIYAKSDT